MSYYYDEYSTDSAEVLGEDSSDTSQNSKNSAKDKQGSNTLVHKLMNSLKRPQSLIINDKVEFVKPSRLPKSARK